MDQLALVCSLLTKVFYQNTTSIFFAPPSFLLLFIFVYFCLSLISFDSQIYREMRRVVRGLPLPSNVLDRIEFYSDVLDLALSVSFYPSSLSFSFFYVFILFSSFEQKNIDAK